MDEFKSAIKNNWRLIVFTILVVITVIFISIYKKESNKITTISDSEKKEVFEDNAFKSKKYKTNEYQIISIEESDILQEYFKDFITNALNDPEIAFSKLSDTSKDKFQDVEGFKDYIKSIKNIHTKEAKLSYYLKDKRNEHKYELIDSSNNKYILIEKAVWDYEITIENSIK